MTSIDLLKETMLRFDRDMEQRNRPYQFKADEWLHLKIGHSSDRLRNVLEQGEYMPEYVYDLSYDIHQFDARNARGRIYKVWSVVLDFRFNQDAIDMINFLRI